MFKTGLCCKCFKKCKAQRHHVFPIRFFGSNNSILFVCDKCHKEIENILPKKFVYSEAQYIEIHQAWLKGYKPIVKGD